MSYITFLNRKDHCFPDNDVIIGIPNQNNIQLGGAAKLSKCMKIQASVNEVFAYSKSMIVEPHNITFDPNIPDLTGL
jgi:hypothetical protein